MIYFICWVQRNSTKFDQSWKKLADFGARSNFQRSLIPREQKEKRERKSERAIELLSTLHSTKRNVEISRLASMD
jgi:hypothetical protein